MNELSNFFEKLFDTSDFPPRWHCGKWTDFHGWLYIISDLLIWSAYFAIPVIILSYISKRKNIRFHRIYFLFATFILACGLTHFLDAVMFWYPMYRLSALVRLVTGVVSWLTVFNLIKVLPTAFALKSPLDLETEVEQRRLAEEELIIKNKQLNEAQDIAKLGHWEWDVVNNKLEWSLGLYKIYGLPPQQPVSYEKFIERVHPDDRENVSKLIQNVSNTKVFPDYFHRVILKNGQVRTMHAKGEVLLDARGNVVKMLGTGQDVTEAKKWEFDLVTKTRELEEVNLELEKFAYVASHDLQEPLRKMITYTNLLDKEFKEQLGERGFMFIKKIASSSVRMQNLIRDILNLSRFSSEVMEFNKVDLNVVVQNVLSDLEIPITNASAKINIDPLPEIEANESQMQQLFQNLLSNAIKFSKDGVSPVIRIKSSEIMGTELPDDYNAKMSQRLLLAGKESISSREKFCMISVTDNGIGFNPEYGHRIFEVFQRLNNKQKFEGTGIGLAICKKIIENHNGIIEAKSVEGQGTEFVFVVPVLQENFKKATESTDKKPLIKQLQGSHK